MRYSIDDLIKRAQAGNIGQRGLHRLSAAGFDAGPLAASGVDASAQLPDVGAAIGTRREGLFLRAIQRAQAAAAAGQQVGAGTQARLHAGFESSPGVHLTSPEANTFTGDNLAAMIDHFRKRRSGTLSNASVYSTL